MHSLYLLCDRRKKEGMLSRAKAQLICYFQGIKSLKAISATKLFRRMLREPRVVGSNPTSSPSTGGIAQLVEQRKIFSKVVLLMKI